MHDHPRHLGPQPEFVPTAARLLELHRHAMRPSFTYELRIRHDAWCRHWHGEPCDCDPECSLIEVGTPERN